MEKKLQFCLAGGDRRQLYLAEQLAADGHIVCTTALEHAPAELSLLRGRLRAVHIHDNDGVHDTHLIPGECPSPDAVDWADAAEGLRLADFLATGNRCLDMELKTSDLPDNRTLRMEHAAKTVAAARALAERL